MKVRFDLYLDDDETAQEGDYLLPAVPRKGEHVVVDKFSVTGTVQTVTGTPDEEQQDVVLAVHAE